MELKQYLENKNTLSKFIATQSDVGGIITFSNSGKSGNIKQFSLGLESFISIFEDIKNNISFFALHTNYVEQDWRDIGSQYFTDGPSNAMSTVQTKPLFCTISKIMAWANEPVLDDLNTDQNCEIKLEYINNTINKLKLLSESYIPTQAKLPNSKSHLLKKTILITSNKIREFAFSVFKYFYNDKWEEVINNTTKKNAIHEGQKYLSHDYYGFKRLIAEFEEPKNKEQLTSSHTQRYFEEPLNFKDDKYYYFSTQWSTAGENELSFNILKHFFEKKYNGYQISYNENTFELSKEEIIEPHYITSMFCESVNEAGLKFSKHLTQRFISSLLTKPFVILTGLSGSGKTKLAQAFALWICENETQYCIVPVGADWTNREPLLGFANALESSKYVKPDNGVLDLIIASNTNADKPYFLILDEMNLSHVERYFADFLSVMESKGNFSLHAGMGDLDNVPAKLKLPSNLFIIGTVNIDETTYMFSPKVLDRASVIEFRVTPKEMEAYLDSRTSLNLDSLIGLGSDFATSFVSIGADKTLTTDKQDEIKNTLLLFFSELKKTGSEFGYRSAAEIIRFAAVIKLIEPEWQINQIIDAAIMQKLLPKVHGARRKLEPVLKALASFCIVDGGDINTYFQLGATIDFSDTLPIKYPISLEKILRMNQGLIQNGFTSYAEA